MKKILVTGDISLYLNILGCTNKCTEMSKSKGVTHIYSYEGSYQLYQFIQKLTSERVMITFGYKKKIFSKVNKYPVTNIHYAIWGKIDHKIVTSENVEGWIIRDKLGFNDNSGQSNTTLFGVKYFMKTITKSDYIIFDDCENQFRNNDYLWNYLLEENDSLLGIILKTNSPLGRGKLFLRLTTNFKDKLTIITSITEIRKNNVMISKGISWEQTALDLIYELTFNSILQKFLKCKYLIITIECEGVLYLQMKENKIYKARLIFDPQFQEGEWEIKNHYEGQLVDLINCFTAGFVSELIKEDFNFEIALTKCLSFMRSYKIYGYKKSGNLFNPSFENIKKLNFSFASAFVPIPENILKEGISNSYFKNIPWSILQGNYCLKKTTDPLYSIGLRVALFGENELKNVPFLKKNSLLTYDRSEIESLRNIENLISEYKDYNKGDKPLSLAVFGAPGSGKSFAVKQLGESLNMSFIEFNLSQFENEEEISGALHQVRDKVLTDVCPIVFWDEFDSQNYKWLQYLLAPMQDGTFQEVQITHPIGKCVFIFAGGTCFTFDSFGRFDCDYPKNKKDPYYDMKVKEFEINIVQENHFKLMKGPDFISRLSGYLNVKGPNQIDLSDIFFPIRRALFIRSILQLDDKKELNIDFGLLNALIKTDKYLHGSRSLEKIIKSLKYLDGYYNRSYLPPCKVLSMLINYDNFMNLMNQSDSLEKNIFIIAKKIHENWMKIGDKEGWKLEYHKDYFLLPRHLIEENIAAAYRIQIILEENDYILVREDELLMNQYEDFNEVLDENIVLLEKMSKREHELWMEYKQSTGWEYNENRNDDKYLHNCMIEWSELNEKERKKDIKAIRNFSAVLDNIGFKIVKGKKE